MTDLLKLHNHATHIRFWLAAFTLIPAVPAFAQIASLQPLYSERTVEKTEIQQTPTGPVTTTIFTFERDVVFEPRLVGVWGDPEKRTPTLVFEPGKEGAYKVTWWNDLFRRDAIRDHYEVHLVRLGEFLFLDAGPDVDGLEALFEAKGESYGPLLPVHFVCRVRLEGDVLRISYLDSLPELDEAEAARIAVHVNRWGHILIVPTEQLQALLLSFAGDESAFTDFGELRRLE